MAAVSAADSQSSHLRTLPAIWWVCLCTAPQTYVRAAASKAREMAVDVAKNQERGCTDGPVVSLAVSGSRPGNAGAKSTQKPPARAGEDEDAPENAENHLAEQFCATDGRHPSHQRQRLAVYTRDRPISNDHFRSLGPNLEKIGLVLESGFYPQPRL